MKTQETTVFKRPPELPEAGRGLAKGSRSAYSLTLESSIQTM